jgi:hypothetical protein
MPRKKDPEKYEFIYDYLYSLQPHNYRLIRKSDKHRIGLPIEEDLWHTLVKKVGMNKLKREMVGWTKEEWELFKIQNSLGGS